MHTFKNEKKYHLASIAEAKRFAAEWLDLTGYPLNTVPVGVAFVVRLTGNVCICKEIV